MNMTLIIRNLSFILFVTLLLGVLSQSAMAHCDGLDGPVVNDARVALASGDVTPVLKWIAEEDETEVRGAFAQTLRIRTLSPEAETFADRYFFETVVRLHRQFEGAPYTGLKPAGMDVGESIAAADLAIETGSLDELRTLILEDVTRGLEERFEAVRHAYEHADHNVEAGRHFVHAYVEFVHYAERLHNDANSDAAHSADGDHSHSH